MSSHSSRPWRYRRRIDWIEADRRRNHPDVEAERLIAFASRWAPYGGATEEDVYVHFGLTKGHFIERLWQAVPESSCSQDELSEMARAYPHALARTIPRPARESSRTGPGELASKPG
ncbi:hypothetical protein MLGJGCBP_07906 [Rhodococcus sp. T7]|nr:hypothetical protein MLGJGCBP_09021 [Rhodococcus sp. T7]KAF0959029.1 hypothetical protein MLGJGCBP_07906 [Rhodococcus sp. T7]